MREQLEKEFKKQKTVVTLEILGLIFSVLFIVVFFLQKDNSFWFFLAATALDIVELPKSIKKYKELKAQLQG